MQLFAYKNTEAGIARIMAVKEAMRIEREREEYRASIISQIDSLKRELGEVEKPTVIKSRFRRIEERACRVFKVTPAELKSNRRFKPSSDARQFIMYWAIRMTLLSTSQVGRLLGGRDHTTVIHGKDAYVAKRAKAGRFLRKAR